MTDKRGNIGCGFLDPVARSKTSAARSGVDTIQRLTLTGNNENRDCTFHVVLPDVAIQRVARALIRHVITVIDTVSVGPFVHRIAMAGSLLLVSGCALPWQQLQLPSPIEPSNATATLGTTNQRRGVPLSDGASGGADEPRVFKGTGNFAGQPKSSPGAASSVVGSDGVQLNLVQASVAEAAKTILGDLLGANYVISDKIKFAVTIQTAKPVSKDALVAIFEAVLSADGAALVYENDIYKIVPSAEAQAAGSPIRTSSKQSTQPGHGTHVIPLQHVAAAGDGAHHQVALARRARSCARMRRATCWWWRARRATSTRSWMPSACSTSTG